MRKLKLNVKYRGHTYKLPIKEALSVKRYTLLLFMKRQKRRIYMIPQYLKNVLVVIPLWCVYIIGVLVWAHWYRPSYTFMDVIWDMKSTFFSSIIITGLLSVMGGIKTYSEELQNRFNAYVSLLFDANEFHNNVVVFMCDGVDIMNNPRSPFYTFGDLKCAHRLLCEHSKNKGIEHSKIRRELTYMLGCILDLKRFNSCKWFDSSAVYSVHSLNKEVNILLSKCDESRLSVHDIIQFETHLHFLLVKLRFPWRRDNQINKKIRLILKEHAPEEIKHDYYAALFFENDEVVDPGIELLANLGLGE